MNLSIFILIFGFLYLEFIFEFFFLSEKSVFQTSKCLVLCSLNFSEFFNQTLIQLFNLFDKIEVTL